MAGKAVTRKRVTGGWMESRPAPDKPGWTRHTFIEDPPKRPAERRATFAEAARLEAERLGYPVTGGIRKARSTARPVKAPAKLTTGAQRKRSGPRSEGSIAWARKIAARLRKDRARRLPVEGRSARETAAAIRYALAEERHQVRRRRERRRVDEPVPPFGDEWLIEGIQDVGRAVRKVKAPTLRGRTKPRSSSTSRNEPRNSA